MNNPIVRALVAALARIPSAERRAAEDRLRNQLGKLPELDEAKAELAIQEARGGALADPVHAHRRRWRDAPGRQGDPA